MQDKLYISSFFLECFALELWYFDACNGSGAEQHKLPSFFQSADEATLCICFFSFLFLALNAPYNRAVFFSKQHLFPYFDICLFVERVAVFFCLRAARAEEKWAGRYLLISGSQYE